MFSLWRSLETEEMNKWYRIFNSLYQLEGKDKLSLFQALWKNVIFPFLLRAWNRLDNFRMKSTISNWNSPKNAVPFAFQPTKFLVKWQVLLRWNVSRFLPVVKENPNNWDVCLLPFTVAKKCVTWTSWLTLGERFKLLERSAIPDTPCQQLVCLTHV